MDNITRSKPYVAPRISADNLIRVKTLERHLTDFILWGKISGHTEKTRLYYQASIGRFVRFCRQFGVETADQVQDTHIQEFMLSCMETMKAVSVHDRYRAVRRFLNWLLERGVIDYNPALAVKPPKVPKVIIQAFRSSHITDLLTLCDDRTFLGARNRAMILMLLDTGLRVHEMANIKRDELDFDNETVRVMGKGQKERVVRFGRKTQKAVMKYLLFRADNLPELWLSEERKPVQLNCVQIMLYRLGKQAEITDVRCSAHTFRHTFAINYLRNGGDVFTLQYLLGHSSLDMTQRYVSSLRSEDAIRGHQKFSPVDNMKF